MRVAGVGFLWFLLPAFLFTRVVLASDWKPVALKFPKVDDNTALNITAIGSAGPDTFYLATSRSRLYLWNGKDLEEIKHDESGDPDWTIRRIVVNAADDVWAFGDNGLSMHFDGKKWEHIRNPLTGTDKRKARLWGAACAGRNLCFAGSESGRLIKWDGKKWDEILGPVNDDRIYAIQLTAPDSGWMVGEGFFARWDGKKWKRAEMKDVPRVYDVALIGRDWGWAVGDGGAFFVYDGDRWKPETVKGSLFRLRAIACATKSSCLAVGEAGAILEWNGSQWHRIRLDTVDRLTAVGMADGVNLIGGDKSALFENKP